MDSSKKAILVTGASSGIGAAIAVRLVEDGHQVVGTHRGAPGKSAGGLELITLDVRSDDSARSCVEAFLQKAGRIDVLVNNAGILGGLGVRCPAVRPEPPLRLDAAFFGESPSRYIVSVPSRAMPEIQSLARRHHVELSLLGLAGGEVLEFEGQLKLSLEEMRQAWEVLVN